MEYDKSYAIFSNVNTATQLHDQTENLIHESGRLQLNTYQAFIKNLMNPQSDLRSLMLVHMTGTGKTITALATATEYVKQYSPNIDSVSSVIVIGFTKDIFKKELLSHPEFLFVSAEESKELKELESIIQDSTVINDQYLSKKKSYHRRLIKKEVKGIYQFYGYRQFANRVINMEDIQTMIKKQFKTDTFSEKDVDVKLIKQWIKSGDVRINTNFIKSLAKSLFICDEVHNIYSNDVLNTYGLAIQIVFDYFFNTLPPNDIDYGSVRSLLLSATPLTTSALEIIPIVEILTGEKLEYTQIFKPVNGVDQITSSGMKIIRNCIAGKISYIMDDNPKEYPSSSFIGKKISGINYIKFIRSTPKGFQLNSYTNWLRQSNGIEERGSNTIKDITFPSTEEHPNGVYYNKSIADLEHLPPSLAVYKSSDGLTTSNIYKIKNLGNYSCKYETLINHCLEMKNTQHGKIFIYHPFVQGSGTDLICSILLANGFLMHGDEIVSNSLCMKCNKIYANHKSKSIDHEFVPVRFIYINGSLQKSIMDSRLSAFNNEQNTLGEKIKIIVGSRAMRESHTLKACKNVFIVHEPSSISEMIQIIGRAVRKHVHAALPLEMRNVDIRIFTTDVSKIKKLENESSINEEYAYKNKVLQYEQIDRVNRIMYDVSVDYLINFRFKLKETPELIGESYSLDTQSYNKYEKILTQSYAQTRNGISPNGIHTNRFNLFYFDSEVKVVIMIIKRIILDHQSILMISQLRDLIRNPPFHIEYNTQLISDESITIAIHKVSFKDDQLRMIMPTSILNTVESLFDQSPILVDSKGVQYRIVCYGDPLCMDAFIFKRTLVSIIDLDTSIINTFRQAYVVKPQSSIDLKELSFNWAKTIDLNDVIEDIENEWKSNNEKNIKEILHRLPMNIHAELAEWLISKIINYVLKARKIKSSFELMVFLYEYYKSKRLVITVSELKDTKFYQKYKPYDKGVNQCWYIQSKKPSLASMPVCHIISDSIYLIDPINLTWSNVDFNGQPAEARHPYGFYIYEEKIKNTLKVVLKVNIVADDKSSQGITMLFLPTTEIEKIATKLKVKLASLKFKKDMIDKIEKMAWTIQAKLATKKLIYRSVEL